MTITEKILARASGRKSLSPAENIWLNVDVLMTHDVCGPPTIAIWEKEFGKDAKIWDKEKLVILPDHYIHTKNPQAIRNVEIMRRFAEAQALPNYYDPCGDRYRGVCHVALAEEGFNLPGTVLFGTDSHTCTSGAFGMFSTGVGNTDAAFIMGSGKIWERVPESMKFRFDGEMPEYLMAKDFILKILGDIGTDGATYRAMEFCGSAISSLPIYERMTLTNMAIETGAMNGIIEADSATLEFLKGKTKKDYDIFCSDPDAGYYSEHQYNAEDIEPMVARPHSPGNTGTARSLKGTRITKCYIGSCTGGKITDFLQAARIFSGHSVRVPTFIVPATPMVARGLDEKTYNNKTLKEIFISSGCTIAKPSCAACLGGPIDTIGRSEDSDSVISTTNRNFPGRMGSKKADVYLASPLTAASSALKGEITDPREFLR